MAIMYDDSSREVRLLFSRIWIRLVAHLTHVPARRQNTAVRYGDTSINC